MTSSLSKIFVVLMMTLTWAGPARAQSETEKAGVTPPPGDLPVPVTVGVYLIDITNIDETRNTFDVEMDVAVSWTDSRLAFDPAIAGSDRRVYVGAESENLFKSIWTRPDRRGQPGGAVEHRPGKDFGFFQRPG